MKVKKEGITASVGLDVVTDVSGSAHILQNNLAGIVKLQSLTASLKWSEIGNLHMYLAQTMMSVVIRTVVIPNVNLHLMWGTPLPLIHGVTLRNTRVSYNDLKIAICSDMAYKNQVTN